MANLDQLAGGRPDWPTGTVTLLFTDIEGSTHLLHQLRDAYATVLADQREILRAAFANWHGYEVDTQGDSFFAVFARAGDGVAAAVEAQRALEAHHWPDGHRVRVRMGLHTGEPRLAPTGYVGIDVHRAARIAAAAHGGQVLLSQTTRDVLADRLPAGIGLLDLGKHRLKDLDRAQRVFQLVIPGLPLAFPPLRTVDARPNNLPAHPTPLLGRDDVLTAARGLLGQADVRLLTMVGPGGTGKTRVGLQLAADVSDEYPDGVYFVALAPVRNPELVPSTIAHTLGVLEHGSIPIHRLLIEHLRHRRMLLLLDNFEQVIEAARALAEVLTACPHIKVIVTSREPLRLRAEREFPVPPLPLPDLSRTSTSGDLAANPAIGLFVERARAARPDFALAHDNASAVAEICVRLAGLPLAIELAAARTKLLSPAAILERLDQPAGASVLSLLTGGPRDVPDRHRTLRASIEWSYELLSRAEQKTFRRLAIFVGGFTLSAAEIVGTGPANGSDGLEPLELELADGISSLLDKSLIQREDDTSALEPRFSMLEVVREYARERLVAAGELSAMERRHADFFVKLALEAEPHLEAETADQLVWLDRLETDRANVRAAMRWAIETPSVESALRLGIALSQYWIMRGYPSEGRDWLDAVLALPALNEETELVATALDRAGLLAAYQADFDPAIPLLERCLAIRRKLGDRKGIADTLTNLAYAELSRGDFNRAAEMSHESLAIQTELGDRGGRADALGNLAAISYYRAQPAAGRSLAAESLRIWEELGSRQGAAFALNMLGKIDASLGDRESGRRCFQRSLLLSIEYDFDWGIAVSLEGLARLAVEEQLPERAIVLAGAAARKRRAVGIPLSPVGQADLDRILAQARTALPEAEAIASWERGQRLDDQGLIAYLKTEGIIDASAA